MDRLPLLAPSPKHCQRYQRNNGFPHCFRSRLLFRRSRTLSLSYSGLSATRGTCRWRILSALATQGLMLTLAALSSPRHLCWDRSPCRASAPPAAPSCAIGEFVGVAVALFVVANLLLRVTATLFMIFVRVGINPGGLPPRPPRRTQLWRSSAGSRRAAGVGRLTCQILRSVCRASQLIDRPLSAARTGQGAYESKRGMPPA